MKNTSTYLWIILIAVIMIGCKKESAEIEEPEEPEEIEEVTTMTVGEISSTDFYQNFDPIIIFPSDETGYEYEIDLNGDSKNDLEFIYIAEVGNFYGFHGTYLAHIDPSFSFLVDSSGIKICNEGELVSCDDNFDNLGSDYEPFKMSYYYYSSVPVQINDSTWAFNDTSYHSGNWYKVENKFIAFKFMAENVCFIGWIRLGFNDQGKLEIYEYGFNEVDGHL